MQDLSCRKARTRCVAGVAAALLTASMLMLETQTALATGSAWTVEKSPNVTLPGGQLKAVSCSSPDACTAVGTYLNTSGINATLAERWTGSGWRRQRTPNPAIDTAPAIRPTLTGVSCPASNFCQAVGSYQAGISVAMAQEWNGRRWTMLPFPVPAGAFGTTLDQVSCTSVSFCEAVGSFEVSGATLPLAARWNGSAWRLQRTPRPPVSLSGFTVEFTAVSCASPTFCEAWGGGNGANPGPTVAERWNGTSWRLQGVPTSAAVPDSVSCPTPRFCDALGPTAGFVWNGSSWKAQPSPSLAGGLTSVSCVSATFCEAVAQSFNAPSNLAARWSGSAWTVQSVPSPPAAASMILTAVTCSSASSCEAVGSFATGTGNAVPRALAEHWDGHSWALQDAVAPRGATLNTLRSVSCASPTFCAAVGSFTDTTGSTASMAEMWNGSSWKLRAMPGGSFSVSCVSATFCEAVGPQSAANWDGTTWTLQQFPGAAVQPDAVSCATATFCMAVNGFGQSATWDGTAWSAGPAVTGLSSQGSATESVSCVSASFCEAVGGGTGGENASVWDGTAWTAQPTPGPASSFLSAVSCPAVSSCEAVGSYNDSSFQEAAFAEVWDGTAWTSQTIPNPSISRGTSLNAIWCTSSTSCTAVGSYQYSFIQIGHTLGEVWNGTRWSLRSTPGGSNARLSGVSCGASGACTAVGQKPDEGMVPATLIELAD